MNSMLKFEIDIPGGRGIFSTIIRLWWVIAAHYYTIRTFFKEFSEAHRRFDWRRNSRKDGNVVVITGGTRGIGAEVVKKLLQSHMHVIIGCRDITAGNEVVKKIRQKGITTGTAESLYLDLMSLTSVKQFAFKLLNRNSSVNVLINNAGIMTNMYAITVDGFEQHFQVNYLSHFLLTYLLLPRLRNSGSSEKFSRIVNVSSTVHYGASPTLSDLQMSKFYSCHKAYMDSKFLQIAFSNFLDSRLQAEGSYVRCYSVHPGIVETDLWNEWRWTRSFHRIKKLLFLKPEQGADTIAYASVSTQVEQKGGIFLCNNQIIEAHPQTYHSITQTKLWETTCKYLNIEDHAYTNVNYSDSAPDNFNVNGDFKASCNLTISKYIKGAANFIIQKIDRMRSAFYFLSNYE